MNEIILKYKRAMKLYDYNDATITSYRHHFQQFLRYFHNTNPEEIPLDDIRQYILYLVDKKKLSATAQNQSISSIKFYFNNIIHKPIDDFYLPRPRRPKTIPKILNEDEVSKILKSIDNLRDRSMIYLVYSAGLSLSELVYLRAIDVDSDNMKIFVRSAKGDKDRYVVLSEKVLKLLRNYYKIHKPKEWLFESSPGRRYVKRNIQKALQIAVKKSGITKPATLSILKNSFAVHLLEKGVDIRYIQQMLGHKHSKTTMKYLRVSKRDLNAIKSPLDGLDV